MVLCIRSSVFLMVRAMSEVWMLVGVGVPFLRWRVRCLLREEYLIPDEKGMCCLFGWSLAMVAAHDGGVGLGLVMLSRRFLLVLAGVHGWLMWIVGGWG